MSACECSGRFFDIVKAYMMWREGLLIKTRKMNINGKNFKWIKIFFKRTTNSSKGLFWDFNSIKCYATRERMSPLLFSVAINDVYIDIEGGIYFSWFATGQSGK